MTVLTCLNPIDHTVSILSCFHSVLLDYYDDILRFLEPSGPNRQVSAKQPEQRIPSGAGLNGSSDASLPRAVFGSGVYAVSGLHERRGSCGACAF